MRKSVSTKKEIDADGMVTETVTTTITDEEGNTKTTVETRRYNKDGPTPKWEVQEDYDLQPIAWPIDNEQYHNMSMFLSSAPPPKQQDGGCGMPDQLNKMSLGSAEDTPDLKTFRKQILEYHNKRRAEHGAPLMKAGSKLDNFAQEWADHLAKIGKLAHRPNDQRPYGENIYCASGQAVTGEKVVNKWYDEIKQYSFGQERMQPGTGHFTQVVWTASQELGTGMAKAANGMYFVVCNYDPPGNFGGQYVKNVNAKK